MASNPLPTQRATARLRIRQDRPDTSAVIADYIEVGAVFQPQGVIEGEGVSGNARWYVLSGNRFVWSGAAAAVNDDAPLVPAQNMRVHRRSDNTIQVLSAGERKQVFGDFSFKPASPAGAIKIDAAWVRTNIVQIQTPILAHAGYPKINVHQKAAGPFQRVFDKIAAAGLQDQIKTCAGTWVARHMGWDPNRELSAHSWGAAIDLNAEWNGYGAIPAALGAKGSVRELVPLFESEGFAWGGYFKPQKISDGMHFELSRLDL